MNIGKKLIGAGAEKYLPFALSKLRYFAAQWDGSYLSRTIRADDGTTILMELYSPTRGQVTIWAAGGGYEFFSTGQTYATGSFGTLTGLVRGYGIKVSNAGAKTAPVGSTFAADTEDPPRWSYDANPQAMTEFMPHKQIWQVQAIPEHTFYPNAKGDAVLVSCWTCARDAPNRLQYGGNPQYSRFFVDAMYDVAPAYFSAGATVPLGEIGAAPDADWYKRAAYRVVDSEQYGSRAFIILTDATSKFIAYSLTEFDQSLHAPGEPYTLQHIKTNVPPQYARQVTPPLPAWVEQANLVTPARDYPAVDSFGLTPNDYIPHYVWKFNSSATKAAAVCFTKLPKADNTPIQETLPGMVELDLDITLTGPDPQDFEFAVTLARTLDPTQPQPRYPIAVDYAWPVSGQPKDDLILLEGELFYPFAPPAEEVDDGLNHLSPFAQAHARLGVTNLTSGARLRNIAVYDSRLASDTGWDDPTSYAPYLAFTDNSKPAGTLETTLVLACDLRVLGFALQRRLDTYFFDKYNAVDYMRWMTTSMQLDVLMHGALAESRQLDPGKPGLLHDDQPPPGLIRYYPDRRQLTGSTGSFGRSTLLNVQNQLYDSTECLIPAGAMLHNKLFDVFSALAHEVFTVHPDGRWSLFTQPSFYFTGNSGSGFPPGASWATSTPSYGPYPQAAEGLARAAEDPANFRQDYLDIVAFKGGARTSHLELFNKAYGKSLTRADFLYALEPYSPSIPGENRYFNLRATRSATGTVYLKRIDTWLAGGPETEDGRLAGNRIGLTMIDPRRETKIENQAALGTYLNTDYYVKVPFLRGASLFAGSQKA